MKKIIMAAIAAIAVILIAIFQVIGKQSNTRKTPSPSPKPSIASSEKIPSDILKTALNLYIKKKAEGLDFTNEPCLGKIADDWVLDIAHNPRQPADDQPENQCADFRQGRAHHFIELDPEGNLIKSY